MKTRSISRNIKRTRLYTGVLRGNAKGFAFLLRDDKGVDLFIPHADQKGAQHGDRVCARIVLGDRAEVVKILERGISRITGTLERINGELAVIPDDRCYYSNVAVPTAKNKIGEKVLVEIINYDRGRFPVGKVIRSLGKNGDEETEILACLYSNGFSDSFPKKTLRAAEQLCDTGVEGRLDLREMLTVTIDGEDARDFDDAISLQCQTNGFVLWVHIADVSAYVTPGDDIDCEAFKRGTSVYFPKKAYPMLPETLSNGLCSLREGEDKATLSVKLTFAADGACLSFDAYRSYIRSNHRLTYTQVQGLFDGAEPEQLADVHDMLMDARRLARLLSDARYNRGSIDFASLETQVEFSDGAVSDIVPAPQRESEALIEEFMIAANEGVARALAAANYPCAYRVHDEPDPRSLKQLTLFASCFMEIPAKRYLLPEEICEFMRRCRATEGGDIVSRVAIRCMKKAEYSPENIGHYGLASDCYCHFTSPIRRYPDLMVHRFLKALIDNKPVEGSPEKLALLQAQCTQCSQRERAAEHAERDIVSYYQAVYMLEHLEEEYSGIVSGVTAFSIFVTLPNGVEGSIRTETIDESFYFDEMRLTLVSDRFSCRLGDSARVRVIASDPVSRKITFELIHPSVKVNRKRQPNNGVGEI